MRSRNRYRSLSSTPWQAVVVSVVVALGSRDARAWNTSWSDNPGYNTRTDNAGHLLITDQAIDYLKSPYATFDERRALGRLRAMACADFWDTSSPPNGDDINNNNLCDTVAEQDSAIKAAFRWYAAAPDRNENSWNYTEGGTTANQMHWSMGWQDFDPTNVDTNETTVGIPFGRANHLIDLKFDENGKGSTRFGGMGIRGQGQVGGEDAPRYRIYSSDGSNGAIDENELFYLWGLGVDTGTEAMLKSFVSFTIQCFVSPVLCGPWGLITQSGLLATHVRFAGTCQDPALLRLKGNNTETCVDIGFEVTGQQFTWFVPHAVFYSAADQAEYFWSQYTANMSAASTWRDDNPWRFVGYSLHDIQDAAETHHAHGTIANDHVEFEDWIDLSGNFATFYPTGSTQTGMQLKVSQALREMRKSHTLGSSVAGIDRNRNGLTTDDTLTTPGVYPSSSLRSIVNKVAHLSYKYGDAVHQGYSTTGYSTSASFGLTWAIAGSVIALTKASNDYYGGSTNNIPYAALTGNGGVFDETGGDTHLVSAKKTGTSYTNLDKRYSTGTLGGTINESGNFTSWSNLSFSGSGTAIGRTAFVMPKNQETLGFILTDGNTLQVKRKLNGTTSAWSTIPNTGRTTGVTWARPPAVTRVDDDAVIIAIVGSDNNVWRARGCRRGSLDCDAGSGWNFSGWSNYVATGCTSANTTTAEVVVTIDTAIGGTNAPREHYFWKCNASTAIYHKYYYYTGVFSSGTWVWSGPNPSSTYTVMTQSPTNYVTASPVSKVPLKAILSDQCGTIKLFTHSTSPSGALQYLTVPPGDNDGSSWTVVNAYGLSSCGAMTAAKRDGERVDVYCMGGATTDVYAKYFTGNDFLNWDVTGATQQWFAIPRGTSETLPTFDVAGGLDAAGVVTASGTGSCDAEPIPGRTNPIGVNFAL